MSLPLTIEGLHVALDGRAVIHGVDMSLDAGSYGVVLGPSGAGKSTLLRAVAGLVPARGTVRIGERTVCADRQVVPAEARPLGYLFQGLALWPHMSVRAHLEFALKGRRVPREERGSRIAETLEPLGMGGFEGRRPGQLSGGELQRLALARALVTRPGLLLLDEPTSSVDPLTARDVRDVLSGLNDAFGTTVLHVTHDQDEALALGDRLFILHEGVLVQSGAPGDVYRRPRALEAARFVGRGGLLPAQVRADGRAETALGLVELENDGAAPAAQGAAWVIVRPEDLQVVAEGEGVPTTLERVSYHGDGYRARATVAGHALDVDLGSAPPAADRIRLRVVRPVWIVARRDD